jgi:methylthioribose-1-phosphate isomerase
MSTEQLTDVAPTLSWVGDVDGRLRIIDQTLLPAEFHEIDLADPEQVWEAIRALRVRGAPAIGVAAAYGVVLGLRGHDKTDRMRKVVPANPKLPPSGLVARLLEEAREIEREDREMCAAMGRHGAQLLADGSGVLTHCNAGSLATAGEGTALSLIYAAVRQGKRLHVYVDETRPLLQGARLTAWELTQRAIPATLLCDNAAGWIMKEGHVQAVVTGADRIAANGDTANKIGTYSLAVLAKEHGIPFFIVAPSSTFDLTLPDGRAIPIEERSEREVTHPFGRDTAPAGMSARNPAFDVTPAALITCLVTERGLIRPVNRDTIQSVIGDARG